MVSSHDRAIIRSLASRAAEIAALPVQEQTRRLWRALNSLRPERPMVMIDQVCWNEMDVGGELALLCEDPDCRRHEQALRRTLFQWDHFRVDMVVEPFVLVPKAVKNTGFGIEIVEETLATEAANDVVAHRFHNQFETEEDLEKIRTPCVSHDERETERRLELAHELFSRAVERDPANSEAWLGKGLVAQQVAEKRICFQRVLALDPDNAVACSELQQVAGAG